MGGTGGGERVTSPRTIAVELHGEALRPVIEIDGSATGLTVSANDKSFGLPSFTNTRRIIDGDNYTVMRNGTLDLAAMSGDFIELLNRSDNVVIGGSVI